MRGASRTDSGAHAKGQVVDLITRASYPVETFVNALNWYLPEDIKIRGGCETSPGFSARKDAIGRVYRYTVLNSKWPTAMLRCFSHWVAPSLDVDRMGEAASFLPGTHDFSALTVQLPPGRSPVRSMRSWEVRQEGELVIIDAEGDSFLPHQVRRTNGVLVEIGLGRAPVELLKLVTDGTQKEIEHCPSLPAKGLCLLKVKYRDTLFPVESIDET